MYSHPDVQLSRKPPSARRGRVRTKVVPYKGAYYYTDMDDRILRARLHGHTPACS